jgi:DNA-binding NtrC family response regulator
MKKRTGTILFVEDDPDTRHIVSELMSDAGHSVHPAKDGLEALAHLERQSYDVLVTDYNMPSLNGLYLLTISRALWPSLPVVMVSGEFGRVRADALRQGAYAWLSKPYHADHLLRTIERAVANVQESDVSLDEDAGHTQSGEVACLRSTAFAAHGRDTAPALHGGAGYPVQ